MKRITDFLVNEDRINGKTLHKGDTIISRNPIDPKMGDWELTYIEKDKDFIYCTNKFGITVRITFDDVKDIVRDPKNTPKRNVSPEQARKIKYQIADLEFELMQLQQEMEEEASPEGGTEADKYGKRMNDLVNQIQNLKDKISQ